MNDIVQSKTEIISIRPNKDNKFAFLHTNSNGAAVISDAEVGHGGNSLGISPFQFILAGLSGCSSIDIVMIVEKKRKTLDDLKVKITADVQRDNKFASYTAVHAEYTLISPDLSQEEGERIVGMSIETYCSVARLVEKSAKITYSVSVQAQAN